MDRGCYLAVLQAMILLIGTALSGAACGQGVPPARDYYLAGTDRGATQTLRNVDRLHYEPALKSVQARNYRSAQADLEFILKYFPNHPQALAKMSEVALAVKRPELAEQHFQNAIERYPARDETYVIYGVFLHKAGRLDAAIAQYQRALEIDPNSVYAHYNLGLAYVDRKDYSQANVHAQQAYQLGADFPGLRKRLEAAGAWRPSEGASTGAPKSPSAESHQGQPKAD
jgi:tetratricopeptide (TPR) repeat protein